MFKEEIIKKLSDILNEKNLSEIEYTYDGLTVRVVKQQNIVMQQQTPERLSDIPDIQSVEKKQPEHAYPGLVRSPMVGTVYHAATPDAEPFVKVGDTVKKGQIIMIIEAMKVMNPIKSNKNGIVKEILVENAQPLEYNQPLLIIEDHVS